MTTEDKQLIILKRVVKVLGILLIFGSITVFSLALMKMLNKAVPKNSSQVSCAQGNINLEESGDIISSSFDQDKITLIVKKTDKSNDIIVIDSCSGKILRKIILN